MKLVKRQNLSEIVAGRIKSFIVENELKPGDRLPTEQEMAHSFGVSRVSVREATKALSFLGIIDSAPRRGLTVGHVDMTRVTEYLGFHLALNNYPKLQLLHTRIVLETGALPFLLEQMPKDPDCYDRLNQLNAEIATLTDVEARIEGDIAFHRALLAASGVEPLIAFNELLEIFFTRFRKSFIVGQWKEGIEQHQQIIDALREKDIDAAREALGEHLVYHKEHL